MSGRNDQARVHDGFFAAVVSAFLGLMMIALLAPVAFS